MEGETSELVLLMHCRNSAMSVATERDGSSLEVEVHWDPDYHLVIDDLFPLVSRA